MVTGSEHEVALSGAVRTIAIVTPTWNRRTLLSRLFDSLCRQSDTDFVWVVVDDCSTDSTLDWLADVQRESRVDIQVLRNVENRGKCSSLNHAFEQIEADFYLVVDSDDQLTPDAVRTVREKVEQFAAVKEVGAIFYSYRILDGRLLGGPSAPGHDVVMTRAEHDASFGKYDGSVGYFRRVVAQYRYPEFPGETYVGPTVLQLRMAPEYAICFTHSVVGIAEYQPDGLTASGRQLRMQNPLGMMEYARLQRQQALSLRNRLKNAVMFHAYRRLALAEPGDMAVLGLGHNRHEPVARLAGALLALYWRRRFASVQTSGGS